MALVAYSDDSDLGTDSDDGDETPVNVVAKADGREVSIESRARVPPVRLGSGVDSIEDEDEDDLGSEKASSTLFSSVPAAVPVSNLLGTGEEEEDEVVDVPTVETWKVIQELKKQNNDLAEAPHSGTQHDTAQKKDRKKVKIFVPSLSEFADDDEEEERKEPARKTLKPSCSGSGLFLVLPEPKHVHAKEAGRSLVPHVLTKRPPQTQKLQRKVPKVAAATAAAGGATATGAAGHVSDEDEDAPTGTSDFFSLSEPSTIGHAKTTGGLAANQVSAAAAPNVEPMKEVPSFPCNDPEESPLVLEQQYQDYKEEGPSNMAPSSSQLAAATAAAGGIDEATILRLAGKRGRAEAINFIDVNADDALLTRQEWMTKALSEEKPQHGFSRKREGLPTQKQKQKHQITYLAHQARERELDLKNTWAQNKMTKMQSQAKYGF